jgi:hypothetical protein
MSHESRAHLARAFVTEALAVRKIDDKHCSVRSARRTYFH